MVTEHKTEKTRLVMISTMVSTNSNLGISYRLNISTSWHPMWDNLFCVSILQFHLRFPSRSWYTIFLLLLDQTDHFSIKLIDILIKTLNYLLKNYTENLIKFKVNFYITAVCANAITNFKNGAQRVIFLLYQYFYILLGLC